MEMQPAPTPDNGTSTLQALFSVGLKVLRPKINPVLQSSAKGGSYLQITQRGQSVNLPMADYSHVRTTVTTFR